MGGRMRWAGPLVLCGLVALLVAAHPTGRRDPGGVLPRVVGAGAQDDYFIGFVDPANIVTPEPTPEALPTPAVPPPPRSPLTEGGPPVLLVDHSDRKAWIAVRKALAGPTFAPGEPRYARYADLSYLSEQRYDGWTLRDVQAELDGQNFSHQFVVLVDRTALTRRGHPVLVVEIRDFLTPGRAFRAMPGALQQIQSTLADYTRNFTFVAESVDEDGVFRGF